MSETKPNIAIMTSIELEAHIETLAATHSRLMTALRALSRARKAEEESKGSDDHPPR